MGRPAGRGRLPVAGDRVNIVCGAGNPEYILDVLEGYQTYSTAFQIAQNATEAANNWMLAKYDAVNGQALRRMIGAGAELLTF